MIITRIKKYVAVLLTALILLLSAACGSGNGDGTVTTDIRPEVFSQDEYVLYQNVFYNGYGKDLDGAPVKKEGVFATVYDAYNNRQRYYVWGYYDQTRCCDWQWEFVPQKGADLPPAGSLVSVTGTFVSDKSALDGYWIVNAKISSKKTFSGASTEADMRSMSCTLERVQMINISTHPDDFNNKEFSAYGRIASLNSLEDPYYDGSWNIEISWDGELPGIGTLVEITGSIRDGKLIVRSMKEI